MTTDLAVAQRDVVCVDDFISPHACEQILRELRFSFWQPSGVMKREPDGSIGTQRRATRRSESTTEHWFSPPLQMQLDSIEVRVGACFGIDANRLESWQATRYQPSDGFHYHVDAGYHHDERSGDREFTLLLYLEAPLSGGATHFQDLDLEFAPEPGRLLLWRNLRQDGSVDLFMSHAGLPVEAGQKTVLVTWARERALETDRRRQNRSNDASG